LSLSPSCPRLCSVGGYGCSLTNFLISAWCAPSDYQFSRGAVTTYCGIEPASRWCQFRRRYRTEKAGDRDITSVRGICAGCAHTKLPAIPTKIALVLWRPAPLTRGQACHTPIFPGESALRPASGGALLAIAGLREVFTHEQAGGFLTRDSLIYRYPAGRETLTPRDWVPSTDARASRS